jgi:hypothetical protein
MTTTPEKITFGELCASGVTEVLFYCADYRCTHHITMSADRWPDRLSDIEPNFVCTAWVFVSALRANNFSSVC